MKIIFALFLSTILSGCAALNQFQRQTAENAEAKAAEKKANQEAAFRQAALWKIGASEDEFLKEWGEPDGIKISDDQTVALFDTVKGPYIFTFTKKKLSGWVPNYDRQSQIDQEAQKQEIQKMQDAQSWQNTANALNQMNMQGQMNKIESNQRQIINQQNSSRSNNGGYVPVYRPGR